MLEDENGRNLKTRGLDGHWTETYERCTDCSSLWDYVDPIFAKMIDELLPSSEIRFEDFAKMVSRAIPDLLVRVQEPLPNFKNEDLPGLLGMVLWNFLAYDERATWVLKGKPGRPKHYRLKESSGKQKTA